jgi:polyhydroxybutyrate depolymerase
MRKIIVSFLSLALLISINFATAQSIDAGRGELPLTVPSNYDASTPAPLIVLLHGYGKNAGAAQDAYMKFSKLANDYGFLFVAPNGQKETQGNKAWFWNASDACCNFQSSQVSDVDYLIAVIDNIKSQYSVDTNRVYLIGHSNGGFMAYRTAYEKSGTIAAIASLTGAGATLAGPAPLNPVHILHIHGTDDNAISYEGGDLRGNSYPSAIETVERWAGYNGCDIEGSEVAHLDLDRNLPGLDSIVVRYDNSCRAGGSAELWTITNGAHIPAISDSFSTTVVEWLMAHPKIGSTSTD